MLWKPTTLSLTVAVAVAMLNTGRPAAVFGAAAIPSIRVLNPALISTNVKWVIYWNVDNTMALPDAGELLIRYLNNHPGVKMAIQRAEVIIGNRFPDDFHDVLITGTNARPGQGRGVVVIHAIASQEHINGMLSLNSSNTTITVSKTSVHIIPGKHGHTTFEASPIQGTFLVSRSEKSLVDELKVINGQAPAMKANSPLLAGCPSYEPRLPRSVGK